MKLSTQYSKVTIISSVIVLLISGIGYYFLLNYVITRQLDDTLHVEEVEILDYVTKNNTLPKATVYHDQRISFKETSEAVQRSFSSLSSYETVSGEYEPIRQLMFPIKLNDRWYAATVSKSRKEKENLMGLVLLVTLVLAIVMAILLFIFNRLLFKRLWRPFYEILASIKDFNLRSPSAIKVQYTPVDEFNELNTIANRMTEKVVSDYRSLKDFTDHASHELQTPLAVLTSKLDTLIQDPNLGEAAHLHVQSIYNSVDRMSRLSQSLLLMTRIESNQFSMNGEVNINDIILTQVRELEEWIRENSLEVNTHLHTITVTMNEYLAETLVSNLLVNAIRHSDKNSTLNITTQKDYLEISNPGASALDTSLIFDRFWKSDRSGGTGLGLAIVKQICENYRFNLTYEYRENRHHFRVDFKRY
jgi:signal transduction histidine kinase